MTPREKALEEAGTQFGRALRIVAEDRITDLAVFKRVIVEPAQEAWLKALALPIEERAPAAEGNAALVLGATAASWMEACQEQARKVAEAEAEVERVKRNGVKMWGHAVELAGALDELTDWQNGPPLETYREGWTAAMARAQAALEAWRKECK